MEKNTNVSGSKDSFKNTPHVSGAAGTPGEAVSVSASASTGRLSNMKNRIVEQARPALNSMRPAIDSVRPYFSRIQDTSRPYMQSAESYVRQYPMYAVLGAVAVGAMIGMMIARPSNRA